MSCVLCCRVLKGSMTQADILHMRIASEIMADLDDLRRLERDLPSRSEMVRRLIARAKIAHSGVKNGHRNQENGYTVSKGDF